MTREPVTFYISTFFLIALAYFIQVHTFFSPDVGYLLHAANQILAGEKYGSDIFETNPPMILYLYLPACIIAKWAAMNVITVVHLYITFLAVASLSLCYFLLKKLIKWQDNMMRYSLFYMLLFTLFFVPAVAFAQREHILVIFMLPYLLSAALALNNQPVHPMLAVLVGTMAGLGFALKPFFLVTPCLIELYFIIKRRQLFAWVRIESVVIIGVLMLYFISIFVSQPDYINVVLPLVFRYYFSSMAMPWYQVILFSNVLFCIAAMLGYFIFHKYDSYSTLGWIIALALAGMLIAFLIPKAPWYYHVFPALTLALLLIAHFFGQTMSLMIRKRSRPIFLTMDSVILSVGMAIILILPVSAYCGMIHYLYRFQDKQPEKQVAEYINQFPGQHSIACFGLGTPDCFPLVYDTHSQYAERFPSFWWYTGLRKLEKESQQKTVLSAQVAKDKKYLINCISDDLNKSKAKWVVIDMRNFKESGKNPFNIIHYFSKDEKFRAAWQPYHYLTSIKSINIYERIS